MVEVKGNLWDYPADVRVITTNGFVKNNGELVMGRGCAREAVQRYPFLPKLLGEKVKAGGNHVYFCGSPLNWMFSFPVKHHWYQEADLALIRRSAAELLLAVNDLQEEIAEKGRSRCHDPLLRVVMPRPGCGNGRLKWADVKPLLAHLDDRFKVITY